MCQYEIAHWKEELAAKQLLRHLSPNSVFLCSLLSQQKPRSPHGLLEAGKLENPHANWEGFKLSIK